MKNRLTYIIVTIVLLAISAVIYGFLYGQLFPYSPVIIGFSEHELTHTVVYVQSGVDFDDFERIDSLLPAVEEFHQLEFLEKPRIFIFKDKDSYYQRSPSKARFCAFYNGDLVISPWALKEADRGEISLDIYLRHELSHCLLFQHSGMWRGSRYPAWLLEGVAVYSSNQMGSLWYPSKDETYDYIRKGNFLPPRYFKTDKEDRVDLDVEHGVTFMYSEFACIVDYLVQTYGRDKFQSYMTALTRSSDHDKIFRDTYGIDFDKCIENFRKSVESQSQGAA